MEAPSSSKWDTLEKAKNKLKAAIEATKIEFITISAIAAKISICLARLHY